MGFEHASTPKQRWREWIFTMVKRLVQSRREEGKERYFVLKMDNCSHNKVIVAQNYATDDGLIEKVGGVGNEDAVGNQDSIPQQPVTGTK
jgi:hypothetical protein